MNIFCRRATSRFARPGHGILGSRLFHPTRCTASQSKHTPDTYSKEIDMTPAADKTVNRLDPDTDAVQRPYEAPSGPWSQAGVKTEEYRRKSEANGGRGKKDKPEKKGPEPGRG